MNFSFAISNSIIRRQTAEILKNNTWTIIGALIISGIISGSVSSLISHVSRNYGDQITGPTSPATLFLAIFAIIQFVVSSLMSIGVNWAAVESVDSGEFQFKTIFQPFFKRPVRNVLVLILVNLILMAVTLLLIFPVVGAAIFLMPNMGLTIEPYLDVFSNNVLAVFWGFLLYMLVVAFTIAYVNYIYALITYLPYDFNHLSARQVLKISRQLMKGNKFKIFRLNFYYSFMTILLLTALIGVVGYAVYGGIDPWLTVILGIGITTISFILIVRLALRLLIANAVFYRTILDENEDKLTNEIPELGLKTLNEQTNRANIYHAEPRPNLYGDAVAVQRTEDVTPKSEAAKPKNSDSKSTKLGAGTTAVQAAKTVIENETETIVRSSAVKPSEEIDENDNDPDKATIEHFENLDAESITPGNNTGAGFTSTTDSKKESLESNETAGSASVKKPYDIMGYNTPERTDFTAVNNQREVFIAAEKAQEDSLATVTQTDFTAKEDTGAEILNSNDRSDS